MTPSAQYPRSRYVAMQIVLFLVLLGTVALAHWVTVRHAVSLEYAQPIMLGDFTLYLPDDWATKRGETTHAIEIVAVEPNGEARQLKAIYQQLRDPMPPMDYLLQSGLVASPWSGAQIDLHGIPGAYVEMMRIVESKGSRVFEKDVVACVVLPNGQVLTLQLLGTGEIEPADRELVQGILADMKIKPSAKPSTHPAPKQWEGI